MNIIDAIIETPAGCTEKYNYDPLTGFFKLKKTLPLGMAFPFDFGFIPGTKGEDGDPLDIIVLSEFKTFPGCRIECRLAGCMKATQKDSSKKGKKIRNDRFVGIPVVSRIFKNTASLADLPPKLIQEIQGFLVQYTTPENKDFNITGLVDIEHAFKLVMESTP